MDDQHDLAIHPPQQAPQERAEQGFGHAPFERLEIHHLPKDVVLQSQIPKVASPSIVRVNDVAKHP